MQTLVTHVALIRPQPPHCLKTNICLGIDANPLAYGAGREGSGLRRERLELKLALTVDSFLNFEVCFLGGMAGSLVLALAPFFSRQFGCWARLCALALPSSAVLMHC
jgi:hypothetical protein